LLERGKPEREREREREGERDRERERERKRERDRLSSETGCEKMRARTCLTTYVDLGSDLEEGRGSR
jgi:hypothetical protein